MPGGQRDVVNLAFVRLVFITRRFVTSVAGGWPVSSREGEMKGVGVFVRGWARLMLGPWAYPNSCRTAN